ncbi:MULTISPECIES: hypothetical protein [Acidobacteriaceae]|uniref:hypothetical protein n=1 Tax=Acidobacteriaceae TaxID=204434 RepID=UPI00131CD720|nr:MULTISPECIES: hypothetical protein [Acidobacteriaceae]MDW5266599.1 hypothetical protein [Edaphobacter sp.]
MADVSKLKISGICAIASVLSYLWAIVRGDVVCAGDFTACLILAFAVFGLAAIIFLVIGIISAFRHSHARIESNSN